MPRPFLAEVFYNFIAVYAIIFAIILLPQKPIISPYFKYVYLALIAVYFLLMIRDKIELFKNAESDTNSKGKAPA